MVAEAFDSGCAAEQNVETSALVPCSLFLVTCLTTSPQHFAPWRTTGRRNSKASASCAAKSERISGEIVFSFSRSSPISPTPSRGFAASCARSIETSFLAKLAFRAPDSVAHGWMPMKSRPIRSSRTDESPPLTWQCASVTSGCARREPSTRPCHLCGFQRRLARVRSAARCGSEGGGRSVRPPHHCSAEC